MEIKEEIVHVFTIVAFPLQIITWICLASYRQEHLVLAVVLPVFLSLFAHCVYYLKAVMQGEKIYLKHFFYFQVINGVSMWVVFIVKLIGYFYNWWLLLIPLFVQVCVCVALYAHVRKTASDDTVRQYNGPIPTNDQSATHQNMPREFHAFPTEHKAGNGFLMELKEGIVHALTIVAFPLQIVAWIFFADRMQLIVPIILSIFVHALYYIRVIIRGEKQYKKPFFVYETIVAVAMWVTFIIKLFGYFPEFWIFIVPMFVQAGTCVGLFFQNRKDESEDTSIDVIDVKENERFKKGIMSAVAIFAFPTQLVFFSFMLANGYGLLFALMIAGLIVSIIAHFLYFHNVYWNGLRQFKTHFFYYEVSVAIVQATLLTLTDLRCRYWDCNLHYEDLWLAVLPLLVQVITCTYLYLENDPESVEGVERTFKNVPREFTAFPVASKTNDYEIL